MFENGDLVEIDLNKGYGFTSKLEWYKGEIMEIVKDNNYNVEIVFYNDLKRFNQTYTIASLFLVPLSKEELRILKIEKLKYNMNIQDSIINDFSNFSDWEEKYEYIISLGKKLKKYKDLKKSENLIKGCQSQVWIKSIKNDDGTITFYGDSDSIIIKGLIYLLLQVYSNNTSETILNTEPYFIDKIGLKSHLSSTRSNGLASMIKTMKFQALAYKK